MIDIIAFLLIVLFVYEGTNNLLRHAWFALTLESLPHVGSLGGLFSWAVPTAELTVALLLTFSRRRQRALLASLFMMLGFTVYSAWLFWVAPEFPCNCGGFIQEMTWGFLIPFNLAFAGLAFIGLRMDRQLRKSLRNTMPAIS